MQSISNKPTRALSQFYDWLNRGNVRVIYSWLLLSLPAGGGGAASSVASGQDPVMHRLGVMGRLV